MGRKNKYYVDEYERVVLVQPLAHDRIMAQCYDKQSNGKWKLTYGSNSVHHICPYDGIFRNCADCGALEEGFDGTFCTNKTQFIGSGALIKRVNDCTNAGLEVRFFYKEDL